jgi:hypothetical protein
MVTSEVTEGAVVTEVDLPAEGAPPVEPEEEGDNPNPNPNPKLP